MVNPPIEHGCRCFLVEESADVLNQSKLSQVMGQIIEMPDFVNPVFKESVAKGGRIFSDAHSYFIIPKKHKRGCSPLLIKLRTNGWKSNNSKTISSTMVEVA